MPNSSIIRLYSIINKRLNSNNIIILKSILNFDFIIKYKVYIYIIFKFIY